MIPAQNWDDTYVELPFAVSTANWIGLFEQGAVTASKGLRLSAALKDVPVNLFIDSVALSGA
ncbi:hypothetical protein DCO48_20055 [Pseudomonas sp. SDI]|nr:hypothetical protein DCO48_20055 [Pseudomonas sp. SDI]